MKEVAILLLLAVLLNGCGSGKPTAQSAAGGLWQAQLAGGEGNASGFTFNTQFTVASNGALSISDFEFINDNSSGTQSCFPINGGSVSGSMILTENMANDTVTGTMTFTVSSGANTLTLNGSSVTGTLVGNTLSGGMATGTWALTGSGTGGCVNASGSFTMSQTS